MNYLESRVDILDSQLLEKVSLVKELKENLALAESDIVALKENRFSGHYEIWREKRVTAIIEHYGPLWFKGKKILEIGCGYADISLMFAALGADVTVSDARQEHLDIVNSRYPWMTTIKADVNSEWPFESRYDLIIHMGLLYHLGDIQYSLEKCLQFSNNLVLETEISDSTDPNFVLVIDEDSSGYDQSFTGRGSRPSGAYLENFFASNNVEFHRVVDARCNSNFHQYNWKQTDSEDWRHGLRAMWFCSK
ncbi:MAG: class I SAM-dependent methyltransferase [Saccharospirillaceae bacterium]|nr:class I SAM-dependent methyltransferase [Saccharospirillaceae bacterium]